MTDIDCKYPQYNVVGSSVPRMDAPMKVTGQARYAADLKLPNMLHGRLLRSPVPHARILNIDVSRAKALPGVKAVITGRGHAQASSTATGACFRRLRTNCPWPWTRSVSWATKWRPWPRWIRISPKRPCHLIKVDYEELPGPVRRRRGPGPGRAPDPRRTRPAHQRQPGPENRRGRPGRLFSLPGRLRAGGHVHRPRGLPRLPGTLRHRGRSRRGRPRSPSGLPPRPRTSSSVCWLRPWACRKTTSG